jgi:aryl-alcohol dehydrogenase-like predicted oxidoreductase
MIYKEIERIGVKISVIGLGGHEYLADGRSRGFNENSALAVTPGHIFSGFGGEKRKRVLAAAYEHGINFFDATIDSEKEALGRNLEEMPPPYEVYVQTRPEGMVYSYDEFNRKMAQYELLKAEVQRGLKLLQRERLDFLNVAFLQSALDHDPEYLHKIAYNVERLKKEGLIRFACADTFSGEGTYLQEIEKGCFDTIFINFNFANDCGRHKVLPVAGERGMGVVAREAFMKGALFKMGEEAGIVDRNALARIALKWNLSQEHVTAVVVGADTPSQLTNSVEVLCDPALDERESRILEQVVMTPTYRAYEEQRRVQFGYAPHAAR